MRVLEVEIKVCMLTPFSSGPFTVNGVPLRRVAQAYVIATQTRVDISGVNLPDDLNDGFFRRTDSEGKGEGKADIFADSKQVSFCVCEKEKMCVCMTEKLKRLRSLSSMRRKVEEMMCVY